MIFLKERMCKIRGKMRSVVFISLLLLLFYELQEVGAGVPYLNLAFGKPTSQSSTNFRRYSSKAVDAQNQPYDNFGWCSQTEKTDQWNWWMVDLQDVYTIQSVRLTNRLNPCCPYDLSHLDIEVSIEEPSAFPGFPGKTNAEVCVSLTDPVPTRAPTAYACEQPVTGRYVRVVRRNTDSLHLTICEFEAYSYVESNATVFQRLENNLAYNKPAFQNSVIRHNNQITSADRAVDGNLDGIFISGSCTHTDGTTPYDYHWWFVDLEAIYTIGSVRIVSRTDCCQLFLRDFTIEVSILQPPELTGFPGETSASVCTTQTDILPYIVPVTLTCDQPVVGRYVRLVMLGAQLSLCEFEVLEYVVPTTTELLTTEQTTNKTTVHSTDEPAGPRTDYPNAGPESHYNCIESFFCLPTSEGIVNTAIGGATLELVPTWHPDKVREKASSAFAKGTT